MKLPFVPRARYDLLEHNFDAVQKVAKVLRRQNDRLRGERDEARRQVATLLDRETPRDHRPASVPPVLSVVDEAIEDKVREFGGSSRLRRILQDYARKESMRNVDADVVAKRITDWSSGAVDEETA